MESFVGTLSTKPGEDHCAFAAPCTSRLKARSRPFSNQVSLKLRQCSKDVEYKAASAGGRIDRLLKAPEANSSFL